MVRHLDSNPHNNNVNNLKPGRREENIVDRKNREKGTVPCVFPPNKECWKLSASYAGVRVSNTGKVKIGWWVAFNTEGYTIETGRRKGQKKHVNVTICGNDSGSKKTELLHRLVYEAFYGKIPANLFVTHRNNDQHDNRKENLILGTGKQNAADRIRNGKQRSGEKHPNSKYSDVQKRHFIKLRNDGLSVSLASAKAGINPNTGRQISWRLNGLPITGLSNRS